MRVSRFVRDDSGAVTVDWVIVSGIVVGLAIGAIASVQSGVVNLAVGVESTLEDTTVAVQE